jgi:predicted ABC-type ATPase
MLRLDLVVGPNGAGKSTFVDFTLMPSLPPSTPFVNADEIARQRWPGDPQAHSYDAAEVAAATREALVAAREPFIAETVFSHPSKLELIRNAQQAGFSVFLHVLMVPEEQSVARVAARVAAGGHAVPEVKIRARHRRLWPHVATAVALVEEARVYDSSHRTGPVLAAKLVQGVLVDTARWPAWAPPALVSRWP